MADKLYWNEVENAEYEKRRKKIEEQKFIESELHAEKRACEIAKKNKAVGKVFPELRKKYSGSELFMNTLLAIRNGGTNIEYAVALVEDPRL